MMGLAFGTDSEGLHALIWVDDTPCRWPVQGRRLRIWRRNRNMSLRELADHLEVGIARVSNIERGFEEMTQEEFAKL